MVQTDEHVLVAQEGCEGKYVALRTFTNNVPVASGQNPQEVIENALKKGVPEPVIFFVSGSDEACLY